jgi:hypothetical protein
MYMVQPNMVLTLVICQVFLPSVMFSFKFPGSCHIPHFEILHFHRPGSLVFYGVVGNAYCCGTVAVHQGSWLWVTKLLKANAEKVSFFAL